MRSRSAVEVAGVALGAVAEGIWTGALAAALTAGSWVAATLFATLVVLAAAAVARRLLAGASREGVARLLALTIIIERFLALRRADVDAREFMDAMRQVLRQDRVQEALEQCDESNAPIARIMKAGILKHNRPKDDIREAIDEGRD